MPVTSFDTSNWTAIGAKDSAEATYASVKQAIKSHPDLQDKDVEVFLQGSYANSTNIRGDSDVDIVVMSNKTYYKNLDRLSFLEKIAFEQSRIPASYFPSDLRRDVLIAMQNYYGTGRIEQHNKCIRVLKREGYVHADVVPAFQYRLYNRFGHFNEDDYIEGTIIFPLQGDDVINYPKEHKKNGVSKNLITFNNFKPTVRQMKNLKRHAVDQGLLEPKDAPGYLLECLTYNVPNPLFSSQHHSRLATTLSWLSDAHFHQMMSVDDVHTLFGTDPGNFSPERAKAVINLLASQVSRY